MAAIHGRNGRVYLGVASSTAVAAPLPFIASWSIKFETDKEEITSLGDANKSYVAGLPDASGEFSGFWDDATQQTYTAASDGKARNFYLYPDTGSTGKYFYGTIFPDFSINGAVGGAVELSSSWSAAGAITKVG
jgi:hypothetical protein